MGVIMRQQLNERAIHELIEAQRELFDSMSSSSSSGNASDRGSLPDCNPDQDENCQYDGYDDDGYNSGYEGYDDYDYGYDDHVDIVKRGAYNCAVDEDEECICQQLDQNMID